SRRAARSTSPRRSKRATISPARPRVTASGLARMRVRSTAMRPGSLPDPSGVRCILPRGPDQSKGAEVADPAGDVTKDRTRVARVVKKHKFDAAKQILTSRDKLAATMKKELAVPDLAKGFDRTLLPTPSTRGSDSIYTGRANATTGPHSHKTNSLHVILSGW